MKKLQNIKITKLGGGIGNAQFSTELVDWDKSCRVRIPARVI